MRRIIKEIILLCMGITAGIIYHSAWTSWNYVEPEPTVITEYKTIEAEPTIITETIYVPVAEEEYLRNMSKEDEWYYLDLSMREAENQGVIGHCWVMYTAFCRCEAYGQSIKEVWESKAFESSMCNTGKKPNEDCLKALELIKEGWTPKPLWFRRDHYHNFGTSLCQYGDHCFSCK